MLIKLFANHPILLHSAGLLLDAIGAALLFFFALPNRAGLDGVLTWGRGNETRLKWYSRLSKLGLGLLILGFVLQLVSNHVG